MLETITKALRDYKDDQELAVTEQTTFEELELDSLDVVELAMKLEEELSVTIEMSDDIKSVGDLLRVLQAA
ncbi:MAG: phosphopantetheine-binding protein [Oscillospiraceae bacterium]|nr:phosphopantetheine-binding protein [Oscillospiraceae bacterium]